ncbi:leucine rich repeat (LRR) protein [Capnocytophaga leadbetteri]|uniref:Leucine rich repeat (LRR) protein n=1 Tax=Capnocytophaga leadbetteri TaxID=327575 RepID=A0A2T5XVJ1_9FLAO|nr:leucine-rich repeat protein [Capnocytophaga leadbetteri]PTX07390.1 leucine rich repeat (LRR) protein [Capnocytophaga leadbetteri]
MKTATLILTTAVVAATLFSCGKKDDSGDQASITLSQSAITITTGEEKIVKAAAATGIKSAIPSNDKVQTRLQSNKPVEIIIKGKEEGSDDIIVTDHRGNSATIKVTVNKKTSTVTPKGFEVKSDIIFLKKNEETDVTGWVKKGSGNYTVSTPNTSVVKEAGKKNGRLYAIGLAEGTNGEIIFKDIDKGEEVRVPVYVIAPFTATNVPASMAANDVQTFNLTGVYSTTLENSRYDRVTITTNNGKAEATLVTNDVKNNVGQKTGEITTAIKITAKQAGEAVIQLTNGDGQSLEIKFTVTAYVANNYFNVDADGVLTIKSGVRLPAEVVLPSNAKKVARGVFEGQTQVQKIDFYNVTEIEGPLYTTDRNGFVQEVGSLNKVILRKVEKIGYNAFAQATNLKSIDFPATLKFLGQSAFLRCNQLKAVAFRGTTPPVGINNNGNVSGNAGAAFDTDGGNRVRLFIPISSTAAYQTALNTDSKFRYLKGAQPVDWYSGDTHQAIVDIANFDKVDFSKL